MVKAVILIVSHQGTFKIFDMKMKEMSMKKRFNY